jgi:uncharacterized coiled-coil protein SlyX
VGWWFDANTLLMLDQENELQEANTRVVELTRALEQAKARVAELTRALEKARCSSRPDEAIEFSEEDYINMVEIDEEMRKEPVHVSSLAEPGFGPSSASSEELEVAFEGLFRTNKQSLREVLAKGCSEYKEVESAFMQTLTNHFVVLTIERIQNSRLWDVYDAHKNTMVNDTMRTPDFRPQWWQPARHQRAAYDVERKWCVCVCVCVCVCSYVCMYMYVRTYAQRTYVCMYICIAS